MRRPGRSRSSTHVLDVEKLYRNLDAYRRAENLSWRDVTTLTGIGGPTFTRMKLGYGALDVDALASLLTWLGGDISNGMGTLIREREMDQDDQA
jgi:hypothetical protein